MGDNAMLAGAYGIKNLKRIVPNLMAWTRMPNEGYEKAGDMYKEVVNQYKLYLGHVIRNFAGTYTTFKSVEQPGGLLEPVSYKTQKEAMAFMDEQFFTTPSWLINKELSEVTGSNPIYTIGNLQFVVLMRMMGTDIIAKMINEEATSNEKTYTATEYLDDLKHGIWSEIYKNKDIDIYRRNLQQGYLTNALKMLGAVNEIVMTSQLGGLNIYINPDVTKSDGGSIIRPHLLGLKADIQKAMPSATGITKLHLEEMSRKIDVGLIPKTATIATF